MEVSQAYVEQCSGIASLYDSFQEMQQARDPLPQSRQCARSLSRRPTAARTITLLYRHHYRVPLPLRSLRTSSYGGHAAMSVYFSSPRVT